MRRLLRLAFIALVLGGITTVLVAWGCEYWRPADVEQRLNDHRGFSHAEDPRWNVILYDGAGYGLSRRWIATKGLSHARFGVIDTPNWSNVSERPTAEEFTRKRGYQESVSGWPFPSMRSKVTGSLYTDGTMQFDSVGAIVYSYLDGRPSGMIHFIPMPLGFLFDTLIFALMWFLFLPAVTGARRAFRVARRRCVVCGYDLRGNPAGGCPECGNERV